MPGTPKPSPRVPRWLVGRAWHVPSPLPACRGGSLLGTLAWHAEQLPGTRAFTHERLCLSPLQVGLGLQAEPRGALPWGLAGHRKGEEASCVPWEDQATQQVPSTLPPSWNLPALQPSELKLAASVHLVRTQCPQVSPALSCSTGGLVGPGLPVTPVSVAHFSQGLVKGHQEAPLSRPLSSS